MVRKKIDNRLRILVENGVAKKHRSLVVVVGDHGKDQVHNTHRHEILWSKKLTIEDKVYFCLDCIKI